MSEDLHPVAIAHSQGVQAGKAPEASPYSCPWPAQDYEAVDAWFAGFSLGIWLTHNSDRWQRCISPRLKMEFH